MINVQQNGLDLSFDGSPGKFIFASYITAYGLTASIVDNGATIAWSNGVRYTKAPPAANVPDISGVWLDESSAYAAVNIQQSGIALTFKYPSGAAY